MDPEVSRLVDRVERELFALEVHCSGARLLGTGDERNQCRFAGTVLAEQYMRLTCLEIEIDIAQGIDTGKALRDALDPQQFPRVLEGISSRVGKIAHS